MPDTDLGAAVQDSHYQVDIAMLAEAADVNGIYEESIDNLKYRKPANKEKVKVVTERERQMAAVDYYANVRTNVSCLR